MKKTKKSELKASKQKKLLASVEKVRDLSKVDLEQAAGGCGPCPITKPPIN